MTDPVGQLTTETSYDSADNADNAGNAFTLQQKGFNVFGESLGQTWTIPAAQRKIAGTYTLTMLTGSGDMVTTRSRSARAPGTLSSAVSICRLSSASLPSA